MHFDDADRLQLPPPDALQERSSIVPLNRRGCTIGESRTTLRMEDPRGGSPPNGSSLFCGELAFVFLKACPLPR
jgi:hypothetical protein